MQNSDILGQLVISSSFGAGRVIKVDELGFDNRPFLVVESQDQKAKYFIPVEDKNSYRFISTQKAIDSVLISLSNDSNLGLFDSKKDRINYFKTNSQIQDVELIAKLLSELNDINDRGAVENQIFLKLVDTLALEYSIVTQIPLDESKQKVTKALEGKAS